MAVLESVYVVKMTSHKLWVPLLYGVFISNLFVAEEPILIVGLPSLTALYIVTSPATIFVVAPAEPIDVNPAAVVKLAKVSTAASIVASVVASRASMFFNVVVPLESSIISTPPKDKLLLAAKFKLPVISTLLRNLDT